MLRQLKYLLNSYTDEELDNTDLWVDSEVMIDQMIIEDYDYGRAINLITKNAEVIINGFIDKERTENKNEY
jgi:hypothetical protein